MRIRDRILLLALASAPLPAQDPGARTPLPADLASQLLEPGQRKAASIALLRLGEPGATALAALLADAKVPGEGAGLAARELAVEVLYHLGPAALPALDALLDCLGRKDHQSLRSRILQTIGHCVPWHPGREKATGEAIGKTASDHAFLSVNGFFATLCRLQFDASADTAALLAGLSDKNAYVRELAAEGLELRARRGLESAARAATITALQRAMEDEYPVRFELKWQWNGGEAHTSGSADNKESMRTALARALLALDPSLPETMPGHRALLQHLDPRVRQESARALGLLGSAAEEATGALVLALDDGEPAVAREAATALGLIGKNDEVVQQGLTRAAASSDKQLAARARSAQTQLERSGR